MPSASLFHVCTVAVLLVSSLLFRATAQGDTCLAQSQPNPIAQVYPDLPTGTFNTTIAIIPIPIEQARSILPSKWQILERPYRHLLPNFPKGMYPVFLQAGRDHDIQLGSIDYHGPDFSRVGFNFPFIDLLGDGYSSFTWAPGQMISADVQVALEGAESYGEEVYPSTFDPLCDGYGTLPGGATYFRASSTDGSGVYMNMNFSPAKRDCELHYPVSFFQNITNQPIFSNGTQCDSLVRLFNTSLSSAPFQPNYVKGHVSTNLPPLGNVKGRDGVNGTYFEGIYGIQIDTAFIEYSYLDCQSLQGYSGTGPGD